MLNAQILSQSIGLHKFCVKLFFVLVVHTFNRVFNIQFVLKFSNFKHFALIST